MAFNVLIDSNPPGSSLFDFVYVLGILITWGQGRPKNRKKISKINLYITYTAWLHTDVKEVISHKTLCVSEANHSESAM